MDEEEFLTIEQAAAQLGIPVPRLRRLLTKPEFAGMTQQVARRGKTGVRQATVLPQQYVRAVKDFLENEVLPPPKVERALAPVEMPPARESLQLLAEAWERERRALHETISAQQEHIDDLRRELSEVKALPPAPTPPESLPWWKRLRRRERE